MLHNNSKQEQRHRPAMKKRQRRIQSILSMTTAVVIVMTITSTNATTTTSCGGKLVCQNGGSCIDSLMFAKDGTATATYECDCLSEWTGKECEIEKNIFVDTSLRSNVGQEQIIFEANTETKEKDEGSLDGETTTVAVTGNNTTNPDTVEENVVKDGDDEEEEEEDQQQEDLTATCGDSVCYNGGRCLVIQQQGKIQHTCDCSPAATDTIRYGGSQCQFASTSICTATSVRYCLNNGTCPDEDNPTGRCTCPAGYSGFRCEDLDEEKNIEDDDDACQLQCNNGGVCTKGVKDLGSFQDVVANVAHLNQTHHGVDEEESSYEHCICPDGWTGLTCDHQIAYCGESENHQHVCFHGSTCVSKEDGKEYACDCSVATEIVGSDDNTTLLGQQPYFAGQSCQHPATDICIRDGSYAATEQFQNDANRPLYFCVNHGRCYGYVSDINVEEFPGCDCPTGWEGPHCEIQSAFVEEPKSNIEKAVLIGTAIIVILAAIMIGAYYLRSEDDERGNGIVKPNNYHETKNKRKWRWQKVHPEQAESTTTTNTAGARAVSSTSAQSILPPSSASSSASSSSSSRRPPAGMFSSASAYAEAKRKMYNSSKKSPPTSSSDATRPEREVGSSSIQLNIILEDEEVAEEDNGQEILLMIDPEAQTSSSSTSSGRRLQQQGSDALLRTWSTKPPPSSASASIKEDGDDYHDEDDELSSLGGVKSFYDDGSAHDAVTVTMANTSKDKKNKNKTTGKAKKPSPYVIGNKDNDTIVDNNNKSHHHRNHQTVDDDETGQPILLDFGPKRDEDGHILEDIDI